MDLISGFGLGRGLVVGNGVRCLVGDYSLRGCFCGHSTHNLLLLSTGIGIGIGYW